MEVSGQFHASVALTQGNSPRYPLYMRPHSCCGRYGEEKNLLPLTGIEPRLLLPAISVVAAPTERL
jgi:hypothetical protein